MNMSAFATGEVVTVQGTAVGLCDGTAPTDSIGFESVAGAVIRLHCYSEIVNFRAIKHSTADGGSDAILQVTYRK
jgi:hypothetical protein